MKDVRITVMKQTVYQDLIDRYENPIENACDLQVGQVFLSRKAEKPKGLCDSAWESMASFVRTLAEGGGNFFDGWMKNKTSAMISCNDGFRPVSFYLETVTRSDDMEELKFRVLDRPARKLILKRSQNADHYLAYVAEVGCGRHGDSAAWDVLEHVKDALFEPVGLWLPEPLQKEGTGSYAHGVEVPIIYTDPVPEGFDEITLPPCRYLVFMGAPYREEDEQDAIGKTMEQIDAFDPATHGYEYAPETGPRMQLKPAGSRGYIELRPVIDR
ncbi:MAG: TIGR04076 family protein [Tissierellia bacterium]|jgi:AraC family transcriptional regulator|nr:TIGR04076 family protein [Tissierellia bacterium]